MKVAHERRRHPRARVALDVRIGVPGQAAPAQVQDLSASGVRCITERNLPLMSQVHLVLLVPDAGQGAGMRREILARGAVVRSEPVRTPGRTAFDTAIFFTQIEDSDRVEVQQFVAARRHSEAAGG
jgi:hypothetical protein